MNKKNFNEGEFLKMIRVRFLGQVRPGSFLVGDLDLCYGQKVVAMSERGMTVGYVHSLPFKIPYTENMNGLNSISRAATEEDLVHYKGVYQKQREARDVFQKLADEHGLKMNLQDLEYSLNGKKISFYYTAPVRIDFRDLLKSLRGVLRREIELRQIPEGTSELSEIGPCGPELCLFINSLMENDCSNKKKCNEYYCRLDHKDSFYEDKRSRLPKVGDIVKTHTDEVGRVERLDLWNEEFEILTDQGVLKRYVSDLWKETLNKKLVSFPKNFENISDETREVHGLEKLKSEKEKARELELKNNQDSARAFANNVFESMFGE